MAKTKIVNDEEFRKAVLELLSGKRTDMGEVKSTRKQIRKLLGLIKWYGKQLPVLVFQSPTAPYLLYCQWPTILIGILPDGTSHS